MTEYRTEYIPDKLTIPEIVEYLERKSGKTLTASIVQVNTYEGLTFDYKTNRRDVIVIKEKATELQGDSYQMFYFKNIIHFYVDGKDVSCLLDNILFNC